MVTVTFVAAGAVLLRTKVPHFESPGEVTEKYIEARYAQDWETVWSLLCKQGRGAFDDVAAFAERAREINRRFHMPESVDVDTDEVRKPRTISGARDDIFDVAFTVTLGEPGRDDWRDEGWLTLQAEDGRLVVCGGG